MNRIDKLSEVRAKGEGIFSVTLTPNSLGTFEQADELVGALRKGGVNQLLMLNIEPNIYRCAGVSPTEIKLLNQGFGGDFYPELFPPILKHIREKNEDLAMLMTTNPGDIFAYGRDRFFNKCNEVGLDGLDVTYVASEDPIGLLDDAYSHDLKFVCAMFPPSFSWDDPVAMGIVDKMVIASEGEIFMVPAWPGTQGNLDGKFFKPFVDHIKEVQEANGIKGHIISIGGITTPEDAYQMVHVAGTDGIHSSTAFMKKLLAKDSYEEISRWLGEFRDAMKG